jgi:hypothetical protein
MRAVGGGRPNIVFSWVSGQQRVRIQIDSISRHGPFGELGFNGITADAVERTMLDFIKTLTKQP